MWMNASLLNNVTGYFVWFFIIIRNYVTTYPLILWLMLTNLRYCFLNYNESRNKMTIYGYMLPNLNPSLRVFALTISQRKCLFHIHAQCVPLLPLSPLPICTPLMHACIILYKVLLLLLLETSPNHSEAREESKGTDRNDG